MKNGNYTGWCDKGYKRHSPTNGDRLIEHGLVLCGSSGGSKPDDDEGGGGPPVEIEDDLGILDLRFNKVESTIGASIL